MAMVKCAQCLRELDNSEVDITGLGYRCQPCSTKATLAALSGQPVASSHLTPQEVAAARSAGLKMALGGGAIMLACILFGTAVLIDRHEFPMLIVGPFLVGFGLFCYGLNKRSAGG